jgi:hypothetical protein
MNQRQYRREEYVLVLPLEPFPRRFRGSHREGAWPRHITILPAFSHTGRRRDMSRIFEGLVSERSAMKLHLGERAVFGGIDVSLLDEGEPEVRQLHEDALQALPGIGCILKDRFIGDAYEPHVSNVPEDLDEGRLLIETMLLISKDMKSTKTVEETFRFGV